MALAIRIAAATGRDVVAFCGYHGGTTGISANLGDADRLDGHLRRVSSRRGAARAGRTARPFRYNRIEELEAIASEDGDRLAAVVMEPIRGQRPEGGFLERVREIARRCGAVLVFDEITAGWRLCSGGAHRVLGVAPDVAVFAKGMSNGYPMAAVIGTRAVMDAAQSSFISSTYWTEESATAALATIRFRSQAVEKRLDEVGRRVQEG
jgi:glutamate-1-semialdehyde 2,1-aminomutase